MQSHTPDRERPGTAGPLSFGPLRLNPQGFSVSVDGQDVALTLAEFLLLEELARHPYQALDRDRLVAVLRENMGGSEDVRSSRSVDTHISRLRGKLRGAGYDCIKTMRFVGYGFMPLELPSKT